MNATVHKMHRRRFLSGVAITLLSKSVSGATYAGPAISVENYGAFPEEDSTAAIQRALNTSAVVWVPPGKVYLVNTLIIPSNRRFIVDGVLRRIVNAPSDTYMIANASDGVVSNIVIEGAGELNGNALAQTGDRQGLIRLQKPVDCLVRLNKVGNNRYDSRNPIASGQGCIVFVDAIRSHIMVRDLSLWQREGLYIDGSSSKCSIKNVNAIGDGKHSWSAVAISGAGATDNAIFDITAENCGASSVVLDSANSQVTRIVSRNNRFQNGVNFGHTGKPATGSRGSDIIVFNAGKDATSGTSHCGIQVGGGTTDVELSNVTVNGAYNHCIQISDGATRVQLKGTNRLTGARHGCGINTYRADQVQIFGTTATGNNDYGVNINFGNECSVSDSDLRGNKLGGLKATGGRISINNTLL